MQVSQALRMRRFAMAAGSYVLVMLIVWAAYFTGHYRGGIQVLSWSTIAALGSQLLLYVAFLQRWNLRCAEPSLTLPQVLLGLAWQTFFISQLDESRGSMLVIYILILLFGAFELAPRVFAACCALAFIGFAGVQLTVMWGEGQNAAIGLSLDLLVFAAVLGWLIFFASYVQRLRARMRMRRAALQAHQDTLRGMMRQLQDIAATDELTGLCNRRHFMRVAQSELKALPARERLGVALIDLDHFKRINDQFGHDAGDRVLQTFAAVAGACLREDDLLARYGGEEFVLLMRHGTQDHLDACCERLREAFAQAEPLGVSCTHLSLSAGMTLLFADETIEQALKRADLALYDAKGNGRNRCAARWREGEHVDS
ncbi:GGDEF domain-containing protein [Pseudomonas sp. A3.4]|nr:GGDEF domain-containing protein [Atopomonas sediminilitoris]MCJ8168690.1 GGDEF domain-containing protein [Atopomonas sediminilitoris]